MFASIFHLGALLGIHFPNTGFFHWWQGLYWPEQNRGYAFTSSLGSDFGEITIVGGLITIYKSRNCHVHRCWRIGKHRMADGKFVLCTHCLKAGGGAPDKITVEHIHDEHRKHVSQSPIHLALGRLEKDVADLHERHNELSDKIDDHR